MIPGLLRLGKKKNGRVNKHPSCDETCGKRSVIEELSNVACNRHKYCHDCLVIILKIVNIAGWDMFRLLMPF